jgi:hypothetical protein
MLNANGSPARVSKKTARTTDQEKAISLGAKAMGRRFLVNAD